MATIKLSNGEDLPIPDDATPDDIERYRIQGESFITNEGKLATPADNGTYHVTFSANDGDGGVTTATRNVSVANVAPTVTITANTAGATEASPISLSSTVSDPGLPGCQSESDGQSQQYRRGSSHASFVSAGELRTAIAPRSSRRHHRQPLQVTANVFGKLRW